MPQAPKYQCEGCDKIYVRKENAVKCENKGLPEFKYAIGDEVETIIQLTKLSETPVNPVMHKRLFDIGGEFAKVKITDRYYWDHKPFYTFEHPQIQGQYWRYPQLAFELPDDFNELKGAIPDEVFNLEINIPGGDPIVIQFSERALRFQLRWKELGTYLKKRGISPTYSSKVVAEPINPS